MLDNGSGIAQTDHESIGRSSDNSYDPSDASQLFALTLPSSSPSTVSLLSALLAFVAKL